MSNSIQCSVPTSPFSPSKSPPQRDSITIEVNSDLKPVIRPIGPIRRIGLTGVTVELQDSALSTITATKRTSVVSWHPEFSLVGLVAARFDSAHFSPAVKFAPIHIWRFDPGLYPATTGPGAGLGVKLWGNTSSTRRTWFPLDLLKPLNSATLKPRLAVGASLKF